MIGKSFLGESWNDLIGELKLSYKKVSTFIGDSLARVRRWVNRGAEMGGSGCIRRCCFVAESSMKPCFLNISSVFTLLFAHSCKSMRRPLLIKRRVFERPTLWGCHWILDSWQRWRYASTLPCQKTNPDGAIGGVNWVKVAWSWTSYWYFYCSGA